jgi:hypothetical protein
MSTENHLMVAPPGVALRAFCQGLAVGGVHFFNLEFWQKLVTTTIGVAIGAAVAYRIARYVEGRNVRAERSKLVQALRAALEKNLLIVLQLSEHFSSPAQWRDTFQSADLTTLEATSVRNYELLGDIAQATAMDKARFQLIKLNELLSSLRNAAPLVVEQGVTFESQYKIIRDKTKSQLIEAKIALEAGLRSLPLKEAANIDRGRK